MPHWFRQWILLMMLTYCTGKPTLVSHPQNPEEGDTAMFMCEVEFADKDDLSPGQYPQLQMVFDDTVVQDNVLSIHKNEFSCMIMAYNMTLDARHNGQRITCEVQVSDPVMSETVIANLNVLYSVRNISYSPNERVIDVGTNLTCTADGNPKPTFEWENLLEPGYKVESKWLNITENMVGQNVWLCTGTNLIMGVQYKENVVFSFEARYNSADAGSGFPLYAIAITVVLLVVLLVALLGVIICSCRKRRQRRSMVAGGLIFMQRSVHIRVVRHSDD